ncbi:transposase [Tardiphaga sp. vice352]|uniref:REP-associated tyrosine transposase n=1 Tax=Tardiphaga sp. vice352 TaxID=2592816 RepID=UPI00349FE95E
MVHYRRNWIPGGTFFLTVALADRRSSVLADHIALLQMAFRNTKNLKPFAIDAVVILPEHLHAILILPPSDADYSGRWKSIKAWFTRGVVAIGEAPPRDHRGEYLLWQRRFWEHTIRDDQDRSAARATLTIARSSMAWSRRRRHGPIHRCIAMSGRGCCLPIWADTEAMTAAILASERISR